MASPAPEAATPVESKPLDSVPPKDLKSEANGEPTPEPKANGEASLPNGADKPEEHTSTNGVNNEDVVMGGGDEVAKTEDGPAKTDEPAKPATGEKAEATTAAPATKSPEDPSPKDVEMEEPKTAADKPEEIKSVDATATDTTTASKEPAPGDVAQEAAKEAPVLASESTAEKDSPAEKAEEVPDSALPTSEVDLGPTGLSQLAIETDAGTSPVQASVEVSMTDAPGAKVPREREDDAVDEPAPKRAKTEPKEDEPKAEVSTPTGPKASTPADAAASTSVTVSHSSGSSGGIEINALRKWNDPDFNAKEIQSFQIRDMRKSVGRVKKTKAGANFRDSVERLWPGLWDKYSAAVSQPTDLGEIDRGLRDGKLKTFGDVRTELLLLVNNSVAFNGPEHTMTTAAKAAVASLWDDILAIPNEEPVRHKPLPKQGSRVREARVSQSKPEATDGAQAGQVSSPAPNTASGDARRASAISDADRPKRSVRPPKSKDIDYSSKPSRKKLKPELQFCAEVLAELMHSKYIHLNQWFNAPVDAEGLGIPHYYSIIKEPMDFGKIHSMLHEGDISSFKEFDKYVRLVFSNCYKFNGDPQPGSVSGIAKQLENVYTSQAKHKDSWLAKHAKANPPPAASVGSDDEDEGDDDDEGDDAGPDPTLEVKELEAKLREEMEKQANLFAAEQPNQSMIQVQQGIVNMVQSALLTAKAKLNEYKQKNGGTAGKPKKSKPSKTKAPGAGPRKSGGVAPQPKKPSGGTKKKKNLTAADKDNIAGAINDLEYPHLDKAIDIIKRDTGQMESEDGELELDIDQLSHEALLKLWELCKKVLPGFGKDSAAAPASSPEVSRAAPAKQAKTAAKPKKNKPMSAQEQEARIAQLQSLRELYKPGQEPGEEARASQGASPMNDSSDDSSEEE